MSRNDLAIPADLSAEGKAAAQKILEAAEQVLGTKVFTGGCRAFYSPEEWRRRKEEHGGNSVLVVVHDGGDLAQFFDYALGGYRAIERMQDALKTLGLFAESCTPWYSAIYRKDQA